MEDKLTSGSVIDLTQEDENHTSHSKKRSCTESGDESELNSCKRIKMRDLESVFRSEQGIATHCLQAADGERTEDQAVTTGKSTFSHSGSVTFSSLQRGDVSPMDLDSKSHLADNATCDVRVTSISGSSEISLLAKDKVDPSLVTSTRTGLVSNAENVSHSGGENSSHHCKAPAYAKPREGSECGSSTVPLKESESFRKWNEMKRNGFLSTSHGGMPTPKDIPKPKPRARKKKPDILVQKKKKEDLPKKKIEIAKREQVTRFTKIAAPSGLLNLNPGIINHVRNSKQVHSIIKALVRSKKHGNNVQERSVEDLQKGTIERKDPSNLHDSRACQSISSFGNEQQNTLLGTKQTRHYRPSSGIHTKPFSSGSKSAYGAYDIAEKRYSDETSGASQLTSIHEDEKLKMKLSAPTSMGSENKFVNNEESTNQARDSSLTMKASTVASHWLELLYQDIEGRLTALRRSKQRVQDVLQTELPFLLSKEFSSNKENDISSSQTSSDRCPNSVTPDMHRERWIALFDHMEKALSEEGKHLEKWLNQVKEMQLHCERGLQAVNWHGLELLHRPEITSSLKNQNIERELAVRAAAASIYSTCNFVKGKEDVCSF